MIRGPHPEAFSPTIFPMSSKFPGLPIFCFLSGKVSRLVFVSVCVFCHFEGGVYLNLPLRFENMLTLKVDVSTNYEELLTSSRSIYARDAAQV